MAMDLQQPDHLIEIWFRLRAKMIGDQKDTILGERISL
jgi:hypothetical protein